MKALLPLAALLLLSLGLLQSGCAPADPLDWKVKAQTMEEFDAWNTANLPLMGEELSGPYQLGLKSISDDISVDHAVVTQKQYTAENNPLCLRVNGRTVRDIITEGFHLANARLLMRINRESDTLLELLAQQTEQPSDSYEYSVTQQLINSRRQTISALKEESDKNTKRLAEILQPDDAK